MHLRCLSEYSAPLAGIRVLQNRDAACGARLRVFAGGFSELRFFSGRSLRRKASLDAGLRGAEASARPAQRAENIIALHFQPPAVLPRALQNRGAACGVPRTGVSGPPRRGGCDPRAPEAPNSLETFGLLQVRNFGPRALAEPDSLKTVAPLARERACGVHLPGTTAQRSAPDIRPAFRKSDPPLSASQPGTRPYSFRARGPAARPSHFRPRRAPR